MEFTTLKTLTDGIIDLVVEFHYNGHGNYGVLPFYRCGIYLAGAPVKVGNLTLRIQPTRPNPREIEQLLYELRQKFIHTKPLVNKVIDPSGNVWLRRPKQEGMALCLRAMP